MSEKQANLFKVHLLNAEGIRKAERLQGLFGDFLNELILISGDQSREMSIVFTKLEEASMFAKKAMAMRPENQK